MNKYKNNYKKIENYIKQLIINNEIFDENYIFELTINYCKYSQIEISDQDIEEIIKSTFNLYQTQGIIENIDNEIYTHKNEDYFSNPTDKLIEKAEFSTFGFSIEDI